MQFKELIELQDKIRDELYERRSPVHALPWYVEIWDDWVPVVLRRGGSRVKFEVLYAGVNEDDGVDPHSRDAAILLCHWLSGVDHEQFRAARAGNNQGSFAWLLTHGMNLETDISFRDGFIEIQTQDRGVLTILVTSNGRYIEEPIVKTVIGESTVRQVIFADCLSRNEPPSTKELNGDLTQCTLISLRMSQAENNQC